MQYTETIEPVSIARRMMNIREQVADLLGNDLRRMAAENAKLRQDYVREVPSSDGGSCGISPIPI